MIFPTEGLTYFAETLFFQQAFTVGLITEAPFKVSDTWAVKDWTAVQEKSVTASQSGVTGTIVANGFTLPTNLYGAYVRTNAELIAMKTLDIGDATTFNISFEISFGSF